MAIFVKGIFGPITGRLGGKIYSWSEEHGQQVKDRKPIDKWAFENDPKYKNRRENCKDVGRAAGAVKLLKDALGELLWLRKDQDMHRAMMRTMMEVIRTDKSNEKGSRKPDYGYLEYFEGFDFNEKASFDRDLKEKIQASIDRESGLLQIDSPAFLPKAPRAADFFRIVSAGLAIDFENKKYETNVKHSEWMPVLQPCPPVLLSNRITPKSRLTIFLVAGIEFRDRGLPIPDHGKFNVLTIKKVDQYG